MMQHTHLYYVWLQMRQRCSNMNFAQYKDYGGRGITVCPEWESYKAFSFWAYNNGYEEGLTLDRRENDLGYSPDNCRWVTRLVQNRNSRGNRLLAAFGEIKPMSVWAEDARCKTSYTGLRKRLNRGWKIERAITTAERVNQYDRL